MSGTRLATRFWSERASLSFVSTARRGHAGWTTPAGDRMTHTGDGRSSIVPTILLALGRAGLLDQSYDGTHHRSPRRTMTKLYRTAKAKEGSDSGLSTGLLCVLTNRLPPHAPAATRQAQSPPQRTAQSSPCSLHPEPWTRDGVECRGTHRHPALFVVASVTVLYTSNEYRSTHVAYTSLRCGVWVPGIWLVCLPLFRPDPHRTNCWATRTGTNAEVTRERMR